MSDKIKAKLAALPKEPGVYFFKNADKKIIYVGKASVLKNRVKSYFVKNHEDWKTSVLVGEIADIEWMTCASEIDALFLESELIKRYMPKYNVELKDEKSHLFVKITSNEKYPVVSFVRRPLDDGASYFGPFIDPFGLRKAMRYLRRIFPYNTHSVLPKRVCLHYHLGLCPGLEENKTSLGDYRRSLGKLAMFLKGERTRLIKQLEREMAAAAKAQAYEQAATLRNQIQSLRALAKQIVFGEAERFDIKADQALSGLTKLLGLPSVPKRIETYDISHLAGSDNVASMVVFIGGVAAKSEYRKFKMQLIGNDDFAHMREVMKRRFSGSNLDKWPKPDLLVIDGGKGQLSAATSVLEGRGIKIPAIGLAKREEQIWRIEKDTKLLVNKFKMVQLGRDSEVLKLLQRMRDESHRFAVAYHSLLRSRRQTASPLENIPGIGPATRKKLIKHFGSFRALKAAPPVEIVQVVGNQKAQLLKQYL